MDETHHYKGKMRNSRENKRESFPRPKDIPHYSLLIKVHTVSFFPFVEIPKHIIFLALLITCTSKSVGGLRL